MKPVLDINVLRLISPIELQNVNERWGTAGGRSFPNLLGCCPEKKSVRIELSVVVLVFGFVTMPSHFVDWFEVSLG